MEDGNAKPGQTVTPTSQNPPAATPEPPAPAPAPPPAAPEPPAPEEQPAGNWQFDPAPEEDVPPAPPTDTAPIAWTASEFIAHAKSFGWYATLALAAVAAAILVYLLTRDPVSPGVVIVAAFFFGIYAGHKPRELEYRLDAGGLSIGQKHYPYSQFRSFSVAPEGAFSSIIFMPLKRFAVPTTIYYAPEDEDRIVNLLGSHLPLDEKGHDAIDRLMHRIHF